jgi:hypothetical protein
VVRKALAVLLLSGVAVTWASAATASSGWKTHSVDGAAFSIQTPDTWVDLSRRGPALLDLLRRYPQFKDAAASIKKSNGLVLVLVDANPSDLVDKFAANVNVIVGANSSVLDLKAIRDVELVQLKQAGIVKGKVSTGITRLPAGATLEIRYTQSLQGRLSSVTQFVLVHNGKTYVVTYTTVPGAVSRFAPVFTRSAQSFRFLN